MRSFDWSLRQSLETAGKRSFWGGIFSKSAKKRFFSFVATTGLFLKKTIHSKVFPELLYLPWLLAINLFCFTRRLLASFFLANFLKHKIFSNLINFMFAFSVTWPFFTQAKLAKKGHVQGN